MASLRRALGSTWARVAIGLLLLALVLTWTGVSDVADRVRVARPSLVAAAVLALFLAFAVGAERWRRLLREAGVRRSYGSVLGVTLAGAFTTNFLPGNLGGDAARAWLVGPGRRLEGLATVIVDRLSLFACAVILGWALVPFADPPAELVGGLAVATAAIGAVSLLATGAVDLGRRARPGGSRLVDMAADVADAARRSFRRPSVIGVAMLLGLAYQSLVVLEVWLLSEALSLDVSYAVIGVITPVVLLVTALPISVGGLGVRELGYVAALAAVGIDAADATTLSLLAGAAYVVASAPGAATLVMRRPVAADGIASPSS